jgi:hypothetical protein
MRENRKLPSGASATCASNQPIPHRSCARPPIRALPSAPIRAHIHVTCPLPAANPPPP